MLIESLVTTAQHFDVQVLDQLTSADTFEVRSYLNSLDMLAKFWNVIKKEKFAHRLTDYGAIDVS